VALSTEQLDAIVAQWQEWVSDSAFELSIEVKADALNGVWGVVMSDQVMARMRTERLYCQVQIRRDGQLAFDQRVPHDAAMLRASVTTLARYIATEAAGDG
jgi:hypothetical protein